MARLLAIDYGKKRTGLAVSDEMQMIAFKSADHNIGISDVHTKDHSYPSKSLLFTRRQDIILLS